MQFYYEQVFHRILPLKRNNQYQNFGNIYLKSEKNIHVERALESQFYKQLVFKAPLCITLTISDQNHYLNHEW